MKYKKSIITSLITTLLLFNINSVWASNSNNPNIYATTPTALIQSTPSNSNNSNNNPSASSQSNNENQAPTTNQGAENAKEFMSKLTAEITALFNKYGNSGYPLLNKAVQVIKIVLTYVLRTIEDILVLIHDLLKVATS